MARASASSRSALVVFGSSPIANQPVPNSRSCSLEDCRMRKWFASLAVLGLASAATAQTLGPPPPTGGCGQSQSLFFDDGTAETSWKVRNPTGHKDAFNVDFDDLAGNMTVTGIALNTFQSGSSGTFGIRYVSLCPDNLAVSSLGKTPDI